jgi:hypothetical protein
MSIYTTMSSTSTTAITSTSTHTNVTMDTDTNAMIYTIGEECSSGRAHAQT